MACRWFLIVPSDTENRVASSLLLSPLAAARATSRCRGVRSLGSGGEMTGRGVSRPMMLPRSEDIFDAVVDDPRIHRLEHNASDPQLPGPFDAVSIRAIHEQDHASADTIRTQRAHHGLDGLSATLPIHATGSNSSSASYPRDRHSLRLSGVVQGKRHYEPFVILTMAASE
jgi:hypothetical protein